MTGCVEMLTSEALTFLIDGLSGTGNLGVGYGLQCGSWGQWGALLDLQERVCLESMSPMDSLVHHPQNGCIITIVK